MFLYCFLIAKSKKNAKLENNEVKKRVLLDIYCAETHENVFVYCNFNTRGGLYCIIVIKLAKSLTRRGIMLSGVSSVFAFRVQIPLEFGVDS